MENAPIWTAFIHGKLEARGAIEQSLSEEERVRLHGVRLHVFSDEYDEDLMRRNRIGRLELWFTNPRRKSPFACNKNVGLLLMS